MKAVKVLLANNHAYIRGGAEKVFFDEYELLSNMGVHAEMFSVMDDKAKQLGQFKTHFIPEKTNPLTLLKNVFWNKDANDKVSELIDEHNFNVLHAHNTYTRLSPSILFAAKNKGVKVFITLHDMKYVCPHYSMLDKNNKLCESCKDGKFYNAIIKGCHKDSRILSSIVGVEGYFYKKIKIESIVDGFISPSKFLISKYKEMGFTGKMYHLPNFIDYDFENHITTNNVREVSPFVFVGRLSFEKGIMTMLSAFSKNKENLTIVGTGDLNKSISKFIDDNNMNDRVTLVGHKTPNEVLDILKKSKSLILPSETYENAPISILEALCIGLPVIGSNVGGIPEMVHHKKNGFLFNAGCSTSLNAAINSVSNLTENERIEFETYSHELVKLKFSPESHFKKLIEIYNESCPHS